MKNNIYIIVPVFKRVELTNKFYQSIRLIDKDIKILIIDDSIEQENYSFFIKKNDPSLILLKTEGDQWWCRTINIGIDWLFNNEISDYDTIIIANNDITIDNGNFNKFINEVNSDSIIHPLTYNESHIPVSSGCKVLSWFPYITNHYLSKPINNKFIPIDLVTARFLAMKFSALKKIGKISENLLQYQGDNDFSLRAKKMGYKVLIHTESFCNLYDRDTGLKNSNINNISMLHKSFFSIRSSNNIKYKFNFLCNHFNKFYSSFILFSMLVNSYMKMFISFMRKKS